MGIRASLSFRYIAPTTRTAQSSILTPKIAKIPLGADLIFTMVSTTYRHTIAGM